MDRRMTISEVDVDKSLALIGVDLWLGNECLEKVGLVKIHVRLPRSDKR